MIMEDDLTSESSTWQVMYISKSSYMLKTFKVLVKIIPTNLERSTRDLLVNFSKSINFKFQICREVDTIQLMINEAYQLKSEIQPLNIIANRSLL